MYPHTHAYQADKRSLFSWSAAQQLHHQSNDVVECYPADPVGTVGALAFLSLAASAVAVDAWGTSEAA